jgi:hypothetical protein
LRELNLEKTHIGDEGLQHLGSLKPLVSLVLDGTKVTDKGLEHLKELKRLQLLSLSETKVTREGVADLQKALPKTGIVYSTEDGS